MMTTMTHAMRMDLANAIRDRYAAAANKDKRRSWRSLSPQQGITKNPQFVS
jgi:hypothetical protein